MNNFTLQQLQIIEKVVSEGSITKAAAQIFLTQPALSHQIRDLESKLGLNLFDRVGKKLIPTAACQTIVAAARNVLPQIEELNRQMEICREGKNQVIRLSTECYTCYNWLPKLVQKFKKTNPSVEVQIIVEATAQPLEYLERGELDLAIVGTQPTNKNLLVTPLFDDRMVAVVAQNHRFAKSETPLEPADFADENFIYYNVPDKNNLILDGYFAKARPRRVQKMQLTESIVEMVAAEMGVSIMATWAVEPYLKKLNIRSRPLTEQNSSKHWFAVIRPTENHLLKEFVEAIKLRF